MNDLLYAKQQLHMFKNKLEHWKMHGYDTPVTTYHEQMDEYKTRIEQLTKLIGEMK